MRRRPTAETVVLYLGPAGAGKSASLRALAGGRKPAVFTVPGIPAAAVETVEVAGPGGRRLRLVAAPGRLLADAARRRLLETADGVVFVVDARPARQEANLVHLDELGRHLIALGGDPAAFPLVLQVGHLDAPGALSAASLRRRLAGTGRPVVPARADTGRGVTAVLAALLALLPETG